MRQWHGIAPKFLCRNHLLGEHNEHHKFAGAVNLKKNLKGYYTKGLFYLHTAIDRHDQLAAEMQKRGWNHQTPLKIYYASEPHLFSRKIEVKNRYDLFKRCPKCRENWGERCYICGEPIRKRKGEGKILIPICDYCRIVRLYGERFVGISIQQGKGYTDQYIKHLNKILILKYPRIFDPKLLYCIP